MCRVVDGQSRGAKKEDREDRRGGKVYPFESEVRTPVKWREFGVVLSAWKSVGIGWIV